MDTLLELVSSWAMKMVDQGWHFLTYLGSEAIEYSYLTPSVGQLILYCFVAVPLFVACAILFERTNARFAIAVSLLLPLMTSSIWFGKRSFEGLPDDNCAAYNHGKLVFSLLAPPMLEAVDPTKPAEDHYLVLIVRSQERWGGSSHLCRIPLTDPVVKALYALFKEKPREEWEMAMNGRGEITFSFRGDQDKPNVTFTPTHPPQIKPGPPDNDPRTSRDS